MNDLKLELDGKVKILQTQIQELLQGKQNIQQQLQNFECKLEKTHQQLQVTECKLKERQLQLQDVENKLKGKHLELQCKFESHTKELESDIQRVRSDVETMQTKGVDELLQQQKSHVQSLLASHFDRIDNLMKTVNTKFDTLLPSWVVCPHEIKIDASQEIGRGAYGSVNVATFRGTKVAAKCLHKAISSPYYLSTFEREMDMAGRCRHPNLLQFIGATKEGNFIILTEIMDTSLRAAMGDKLIKKKMIMWCAYALM